MEYRLEDLIDIPLLQDLQEKLNVIYPFPSALIANDGKVLTAVAWQDICTKFHRNHPECEKECIKSDKYILGHLHQANPAISYQCPHGLIDNAMPIIIEGKHLGNFFTGMEAVAKVPVWSKEKLLQYLDFIKGFIEIIAGIGLNQLKEIEANKVIRKNEERYRTILQTAMDGFWLSDAQGRIIEVNEAYCRMSGFRRQELLSKRIPDLEAAETDEDVDIHMQKIISQGEDRFESRHQRKGGGYFDVEISVNYQPADGGVFVAFLKNITERKKAERTLMEAEEKYRLIVETANEGIVSLDNFARITFLNQQLASMLGYPAAEIIGQKFETFMAEDQLTDHVSQMKIRALGEDSVYERCFKKKDGRRHWALVSAKAIINADGKFEGSFAMLTDISARKMAENALRKSKEDFQGYFSMGSVGICVTSPEKGWVEVNERLCQMLGYSKSELSEFTWEQLTHPDDLGADLGFFNQVLSGNIDKYEIDKRFIRKDGSVIFTTLSVTCQRNSDGTVDQFLAFLIDITDRKQSEIALSKSFIELKQFNDLMVGREMRMIDLKQEVNELCKQLGKEEKYLVHNF